MIDLEAGLLWGVYAAQEQDDGLRSENLHARGYNTKVHIAFERYRIQDPHNFATSLDKHLGSRGKSLMCARYAYEQGSISNVDFGIHSA